MHKEVIQGDMRRKTKRNQEETVRNKCLEDESIWAGYPKQLPVAGKKIGEKVKKICKIDKVLLQPKTELL